MNNRNRALLGYILVLVGLLLLWVALATLLTHAVNPGDFGPHPAYVRAAQHQGGGQPPSFATVTPLAYQGEGPVYYVMPGYNPVYPLEATATATAR